MSRLPCLALTCLAVACAAETPLRLVLDDGFDGTQLNPQVWNIETGKRRDALNAREAVDVRDGHLVITTWTDAEGVTRCGFVTTRRKVAIKAGKALARCRFSVLPGTQVAFWAQSSTYGKSGKAEGAAEDGVEIDIMETTGLMNGEYQYAMHWGPYGSKTEKRTSHRHFSEKVGAAWHDYGVEWDDAGYRFTRDGALVATDTSCPVSKAAEFILFTSESNIKGWNGERPAAGYGSKETCRNTFEVDWVKAWTREPEAAK